MDLNEAGDSRGRIARTLLAVGLAVVAVGSLRKGKRLRAVLAGAGALALGYAATSEPGELAETLDVRGDEEDVKLRCAACGQPIRPGELRRPNENDETVHDACLESTT
jgi:uncharacterized membrane protein